MHFLFVSHQSDQPFLRYGQNSVWPWKNTSEIFFKICENNSFQQNLSKSNQVITMPRALRLPFCSDPVSVSRFIAQTSKFLLINATAVTLGQGHGKVIQYISQTHIFFVPNIKGMAQTVLTWRGKDFAAADAAETNWKHKVTPDRGDLMMVILCPYPVPSWLLLAKGSKRVYLIQFMIQHFKPSFLNHLWI